jgi:23S rRNA-/tRNA-specific pseudouridylate synthase
MPIELNERARRPRAAELQRDAIVFADAQVIVVAKPVGLSTIPYDDTETDTLDLRVRGWMGRGGSPLVEAVPPSASSTGWTRRPRACSFSHVRGWPSRA